MDYRFMGRTGLKVSELCLGGGPLGSECDEAASFRLLDQFADAGGNFIDTADVYSGGKSEEIIGRWLKGRRRDDCVIATKVRVRSGSAANDIGLSRKHILSAVEGSLRRLGTDYVDLYLLHCWDNHTPVEETLSALDALVKSGKVRYTGASNFTGWQLQKAVEMCRYNRWEQFVCLQPLYNLLDRQAEWELVPVCLNEGLGIMPWSPLRGGWLTGKYRREMGQPPAGTRVQAATERGWGESWHRYNTKRTWNVVEALLAVAQETGKTPAQVALRWLSQQAGVVAPIIGARTMEQLADNLGAAGWSLTPEQTARLDDAGALEAPYPHDVIAITHRTQ